MYDILDDRETGELAWVNDDLVWGESTQQHGRDILLARPGDYRQAPTATVGLPDYLEDDQPDELTRAIRVCYARDGMTIDYLTINNGNIEIDAHY
jgi:hypothetical protein